MLASMNLLKSLSAIREKSEMRLVEYATNPVSMGKRMSQLRSLSKLGPLLIGLLIFHITFIVYNDLDFELSDMWMYAGLGWCLFISERELQLLRLIRHYREED